MTTKTPSQDKDFERRAAKYAPVATGLDTLYDRPVWKTPSHTALDELIDCILSQSTNDANRDKAFAALKATFADWDAVMNAPTQTVIDTIKPAGLANQKAPRIQFVLRTIYAQRGELSIDFLREMPLEDARNWLTSMDGVGPKTAAIVLCFAFGLPAFPVDTHIYRVGQRIGFIPPTMSADKAHPHMEAIVPGSDHYHFHLQVIWHGRQICTARRAMCERCPLTQVCDYYQASSIERGTHKDG
jgi:endonuclease III